MLYLWHVHIRLQIGDLHHRLVIVRLRPLPRLLRHPGNTLKSPEHLLGPELFPNRMYRRRCRRTPPFPFFPRPPPYPPYRPSPSFILLLVLAQVVRATGGRATDPGAPPLSLTEVFLPLPLLHQFLVCVPDVPPIPLKCHHL